MFEITLDPIVVITAVCSSIWLISTITHVFTSFNRSKGGAIRLTDDDEDEGIDENVENAPEQDGVSPEELEAISFTQNSMDGAPVDVEKYKKVVRISRLWITFFAASAIALLGVQLALQGKSKKPHHPISWSDALQNSACWPILASIILWINIFYFALQGMRNRTYWPAVKQTAFLSLTASVACISILVIPDIIADDQLSYYALQTVVAVIVLSLAVFIPSGPRYVKQTPDGPRLMARVSHKGKTIFSQLWFTNPYDIIRVVRKNGTISAKDTPLLGSDFDAHLVHMEFKKKYEKAIAQRKTKSPEEKKKKRLFAIVYDSWPITRALLGANSSILWMHNSLCIVVAFGWYIPSFVSFKIVRFLETSEQQDSGPISGPDRLRFGFRFCLLLAATILLQSVLCCQIFSKNMVWLQNRVRTQLQMAIFAKALRRKDVESIDDFKKAEANKSTQDDDEEEEGGKKDKKEDGASGSFSKAQVINLVSADAERISHLLYLFTLFNAPIEIVVGGFFAIYLLGWAAVVGLASSFALQPILYYIGKATVKLEDKHQKVRDKRTSVLNEIIQAIRMVKFNAWESKASARIQNLRDEELHIQKWIYYVEMIQTFVFNCSPTLAIAISYAWYIFVQKKSLTPSVGFTSLVVLDEMRFALTFVPEAVAEIIQSLVSLRRIQLYLESDEIEIPKRSTSPTSHEEVAIVNGTITWPKNSQTEAVNPSADEDNGKSFILNDVNVRFIPNSLNLIVGRLGSGKTLLLKALLGEAEVLTGKVSCPRSLPNSIRTNAKIPKELWMRSDQLAYLPQSAFLVNASLRDNILFGLPLLEERYEATIDACGLRPDLKLLTDGDETEIGENGIGLSGGQTSRVMLARAIYSRASTLILDDPLSAVDAHTAAHIHTALLRGPLCSDRTVILVTHQVQLVAQSSAKVVMLSNGKVEFDGDSMSFMQSELYSGLIEEQEQESKQQKEKNEEIEKLENATNSSAGTSLGTTPNTTAPPSPVLQAKDDNEIQLVKAPKKLVEEEHRAKGAVLMSIYARYIKACGGIPVIIAILITLVASNGMIIVVTRWIQYWTEDVANGVKNGGYRQHSDAWWLAWLGVIWFVDVVLKVLQMYTLVYASLRASKLLFTDMLRAVIRAPLRFHDTVSRGRLLNRFGYDFGEMDSEVVDAMERVGDQFITIIVTFAAIATGGGAPFLIFFAMMIPLYVIVGHIYLLAVRDLKRLSSTTRSPILNTFGDAIRGTLVVRAFGGTDYFYKSLVERMNENTMYNYWMRETRYWFEELFNTFSFFVILVAVIFILLNTSIKASQAGFVFTFLINGHVYLLFFLRAVTEMEQKLVSVERIVEYTQLESERDVESREDGEASENVQLLSNWPSQGHVSVNDLHVRYASDLPEVLHGLSFEVQPAKKVGVVGPTGCGKSTLASSFFRFVEKTKGSIKIDGIDIGKVDLHQLRSRLQIVPQDPIIFSGVLRASLDVFDEYTDDEIYEALRKVQLIQSVTNENNVLVNIEDEVNTPKDSDNQKRDFSDLNFLVSDGGSNLSNGEKQLLCLARAILRNCKLIIFDEATSSVDFDTDAIISQTIRQAFESSTIITIAHRLRTIIDYDYVLVMDKGNAVEFAKPSELLRDPTSRFYKLCRASGKRELAYLKEVAGVE